MKSFTLYKDMYNQWLQVPFHVIDSLGMKDNISSVSVYKNEYVYLESNRDIPVFLELYKKHGELNIIERSFVLDKCFVRYYTHYWGSYVFNKFYPNVSKLILYCDDFGSWLKVPTKLIDRMNFNKISSLSYINKDFVYLDAESTNKFFERMAELYGDLVNDFKSNIEVSNNTTRIRKYQNYEPIELSIIEKFRLELLDLKEWSVERCNMIKNADDRTLIHWNNDVYMLFDKIC